MKYFLTMLSFAILSLAGVSQDSIDFEFNNRYDINPNVTDYGMKTVYWNEGFLTLGFSVDSSGYSGFTVSFVDTTSQLVWKRDYHIPTATILQGNDILTLDDSTFYVTGIIYKDAITGYDGFFAKFNSVGDTLFFKQYYETGYNWPLGFETYDSNKILILQGVKEFKSDLDNFYFIYEVDSIGSRTTLYESPVSLKYPVQIYKDDNFIYVGGTRRTSLNDYYNLNIFVDVFNRTTLDKVYTWSIKKQSDEKFLELFTWHNQLFVARFVDVYYGSDVYPQTVINIGRIWNGHIYNNKTFGPPVSYVSWTNVLPINDTLLAVASSLSSRSDMFFLDENLDSVIVVNLIPWSSQMGKFTRWIGKTPSNKIFGTGNIQNMSFYTSDHFVFLTQNVSQMMTDWFTISGVYDIIPSTNVLVYPTLFTDVLHIEFENSIEEHRIQIFNVNGAKIIDKTGFGNELLNTDFFVSGVYVVVILEGTKKYSFKTIKPYTY